MNGAQHYRYAEKLLERAHNLRDQADWGIAGDRERDRADSMVARAQVHATLAQAAATVEAANYGMTATAMIPWRKALGHQ